VTYLVPDTSVYLHCRFFTEVDWPSLVNRSQVVLVLPAPVLREIDKHKDSHPQRKRRERARRVVDEFKKAQQSATGALRPGVGFQAYRCALQREDLEPYALDKDIPDERILATILRFARENPDAEVVLVARDGTMSFTASELGLQVVDPRSIEERDEPDETERELETAKRRLVDLESRVPKLELSFEGGQNFFKVKPSSFSPSGDSGLSEFRAAKVRLHPRVGELQVLADQSEFLRYAKEHADYVDDLAAYFSDLEKWRQRDANTVVVSLHLANSGRVPAESVMVELLFPGDLDIETENTRPPQPKEPKPPSPPRSLSAFGLAIISSSFRERYESEFGAGKREPHSNFVPNLSAPEIAHTVSQGIYLSQKFAKIQQATSEVVGPLFLVFSKRPHSVKIRYTLRADHMEPLRGELHLVAKKLS